MHTALHHSTPPFTTTQIHASEDKLCTITPVPYNTNTKHNNKHSHCYLHHSFGKAVPATDSNAMVVAAPPQQDNEQQQQARDIEKAIIQLYEQFAGILAEQQPVCSEFNLVKLVLTPLLPEKRFSIDIHIAN